LNQDQVYYFKSRGIDEEQALKILQKAFLVETLEAIENSQIKEYSYNLLEMRL
jgi:Fe-S cluster assembly scaffold protein SufB